MTTTGPDPHLPAVHLRPPRGWVNDPNGLVFHDGRYHVFFQYNPHSARHQDMHWGHFTSTDLLHWEPLPIALAPDPAPDGDDAGGVWSGNAVSHEGRLSVFYAARHPDRWYQPVAGAVSTDGITFTKHTDLLVPEPPDGLVMFRDPYVWRDGDRWRMLVGAALADGRGAAVQYTSDDLEKWTHQGIFFASAPRPLAGGADTEEGWECAQYAPFGDGRGAFLVSAWDPEEGARCTAAWTGHEAAGGFGGGFGGAFEPDGEPRRLDHGPDFYAPALLPAPDGRTLMWAWSWEARDEPRVGAPSAWTDAAGWAGMLTLPRELSLTAEGRLAQRPARELLGLRGARLLESSSASGPADLGPIGPATDLVARLEGDAGLRVVTSADGAEYLEIRRDPGTGEIAVDRTHASLDPRARRGHWRLPGPRGDAPAELRVLLDHSIAELFTAEGEALTVRFYPVGGAAWRLRSTGTSTSHCTVDAWELGSRFGSCNGP
ncbi:glycoside hydrolase family 32 protein [Streptomyces vilmorinianum]|uniref:glycoside hydrolase family 32 protein n=1 Tax=Streptomyces vilmorinianum TaxID=3051092 RepID=UPI0010FB8671|nr:glycoside hydrolase family 32 protein [Streptomyces vilmorinianum]